MGETSRHQADPLNESHDLLNNPQVFDLFMTKVEERVSNAVQRRFNTARTQLLAGVTIFAIVLAALGSTVLDVFVKSQVEIETRAIVKEEVGPAVKSAVDAAVRDEVGPSVKLAVDVAMNEEVGPAVEAALDAAVGEVVAPAAATAANSAVVALRFEVQIASLNFRMLKLDLDSSFSQDEAESIIRSIESLYQQSDGDAESRDRLTFAVDTAAQNFAQAGRLELVEQLEKAAPDLVQNSDSVLQIMLQSLGRRLIADIRAPFSWITPEGEMKEVYGRYRNYADRARISGYAAFYFAYELLLRHLEQRPKEELLVLVQEALELELEQSLAYIRILEDLAAGTWRKVPDAKSRRVSERVQTVLCEFRSDSELLATLVSNSEIECSETDSE